MEASLGPKLSSSFSSLAVDEKWDESLGMRLSGERIQCQNS